MKHTTSLVKLKKSLSDLLRFERLRQGLSQVELAKRSKLSQGRISQLERLDTSASIDVYVTVLRHLDIQVSFVVDKKVKAGGA